MKKNFPGFYFENKIDSAIMNQAIVVFDHSVILNFFKLPESDANLIIDVLSKAKLKLWLPYCMACQYHLNLNKTIENESAVYNNYRKKLGELSVYANLPLCHLSADEKETLLNFVKKMDSRLESVIDNLRKNLGATSPLKNKIADLFSDSIGVEEQDPHPYNMDVNGEAKEVTANEKRLSYNGVTIDYKSTEYPKYEKIAFNSLVDRAKSMKASLILIIPQNQSPLFFDELNGTMVVKQDLQNYFMKNTNGRGFYCYTIDSFLREIQKCRAIEIPPQLFTSISICSQFSRQECKFIGNNWYER